MRCPKCGHQFESIEWGFGQVQCPSCLEIIDLNEVSIDKWIENNLETTKQECQPKISANDNHTTHKQSYNYNHFEDGCV